MNEIHQALGRLLRRPAYTLLAAGALALGIGGTVVVYSMVHHVLLAGTPFHESARLVSPNVRSPQGYLISLSIPYFRAWSERSREFESWAGSSGWTFVRQQPDGSELIRTRLVLGDFFATLGIRAAHGRVLSAAETERGAEPVVVLGHAFWQRAFGGNEEVIGKPLITDGFSATIIGVLPPGVGYPNDGVEAYVPMGLIEDLPWDERWSSFGMYAIARLAPGVSIDRAQADLDRVAAELEAEYGGPVATPELQWLDDLLIGDVRARLWTLFAAVGLVLLIACANVANLALARGEGQGRELALRTALGASRGRLVRLLLTESVLLAGIGAAAGIALAAAVLGPILSHLELGLPSLLAQGVALDTPVLVFAAAVSLVSAALFGVIPALRLSRRGQVAAVSYGARTAASAGGREGRRLRDGLVIAQVALSLVLLAGAGLLTRSLQELAAVDKGFEEEHVVTARLQAPDGLFTAPEPRYAFYDALIEELEASPDIESAAATQLIPLVPRSWERAIAPEGASLEISEMASVLYNVVTPGYFDTFGIPLLQGRAFDSYDRGDAPVAIVDRTMAEQFWPGEDPVGKRVAFEQHAPEGGMHEPEWLTVVGVVPNVRHYELETPSRIQVYVPMRQAGPMGLSVAVRHRPEADGEAAAAIRRAVVELQPGIAAADVQRLDEIVAGALGPRHTIGLLTVAFAVCAASLAALGIFGVLSLVVSRRRQELGVRMAIGASRASVLGMVARYGLALTATGSALGLVIALAGTRLLDALLYGVSAFEPAIYLLVVATMLAVSVAAALVPALRAARIDPVEALRYE